MSKTTAEEDFLRLLQQHRGIIVKICNSYCHSRNDREDLAQEITYQLWRSWHLYQAEHVFSTWMYRVALNVAITHYRTGRKRLDTVQLEDYSAVLATMQETAPAMEENILALQRMIRALKELDRALVLLYLESKSYREIAEILGISETNVATKLGRIKGKLRQQFTKNIPNN
ncbi:MAG: RNA polymerase sigma factor [Chitinophagaceae bacterium]|nr:RNA polymerase sigma factor [Chitinophagaceae bacterium]